MPVPLNLVLMLFGMRATFSACDVYSQRVCLFATLVLFVSDHLSLNFLKAILNGLKYAMSRGWSA